MDCLLLGLILTAHAEEPVSPKEQDAPLTGALVGMGATPTADNQTRANGAIRPWGQLQTFATLFDQDVDPQADPAGYGDPEADPGFTLARARIGFDGLLPIGAVAAERMQLDYAIAVGVSAPYDALTPSNQDVQIIDAFARFTYELGNHPLSVSVGSQRVPFDRESLISSADLVFMERSAAAHWLGISQDVGAVAAQQVRLGSTPEASSLLLRLGAFNGEGSLYGDVDPGVLTSARLEFLHGDAYRTWSADKKPALGVGLAGMSRPSFAVGSNSWNADLLARYSLISVLGQFSANRITPLDSTIVAPAVSATTDRVGWFGQLSVWIPVRGESGLEVAGRYGSFDDATALTDAGEGRTLHAGLTWRNPLSGLDIGAGAILRSEAPELAYPNNTIRVWTQIRPTAKALKKS